SSDRARKGESGVALVLTTLTLLIFGPLIGLAIDGGTVYLLKARLSQAVDAACLAGARSLSRGLNIAQQTQSATETSQKYFQANFPNNTWGSTVSNLQIDVAEDAASKARIVTVSATATAPLYFLRLLGKTNATIAALGQARRRDVNVMLVLDRSSSMGGAGAIQPMIDAATSFVNQFAPGRDKLGMVVFGGSYYLVPPTLNFQPTLVTQIKQIVSSGNTGTAQALWVGYKALADLNEPGALNVLLFFTDGLPNGVTADFAPQRKSPLICDPLGAPLIGWISQTSGFVVDPGVTHGLFRTVATGPSDPTDGANSSVIPNGIGCQFFTNPDNMKNDFNAIPAEDYYGNLTTPPNPYKPVDLNGINRATQVAAASYNAADYAARRMRAGAINNIVPLVYTISIITNPNPSEWPDPIFMKRVTNTVDSPIYDSTKPTGLYIDAQNKGNLGNAFLRIASEILRLSQ